MSPDADPQSSIRSAEIAVRQGEGDTAEDALLESLSRVRKARQQANQEVEEE